MELRNLSKHSQRAYLAAVTGITKHYRRSPNKITNKMIEDYLLYLKNDKGNSPNSCGSVMKKEISIGYSVRKIPRKLPTVLTKEQIWKIICASKNLKHRLILMTTYAAGLRASEVIALKPKHIESERMLIKIEDGKGKKATHDTLTVIWRGWLGSSVSLAD